MYRCRNWQWIYGAVYKSSDWLIDWLIDCLLFETEYSGNKNSYSIVSSDFPCYFVAVSRVRQHSRLIGIEGGALKAAIVSDVNATFPKSSVTRETRVSLQVR